MDLSVKSESRLNVSVSFGRFENDALSWEKWSSFSPNKYLEEIGSLSTPGSVAQKKAYFEAHYKKIAAQKAEVSEQENRVGSDVSGSGAFVNISSDIYNEKVTSNGAKLVDEVAEEPCSSVLSNEGITKQTEVDKVSSSGGFSSAALMDAITSEEESVNAPIAIAVNNGSCGNEEVENELNDSAGHREFNEVSDAGLDAKSHQNASDSGKNVIVEKPVEIKTRKSDSNHGGNVVPKAPFKKEKSSPGTIKKVASAAAKQLPASRNLKPVSTSTPKSVAQASKREFNGSLQPKSKTPLAGDTKRISLASLHMSLDSGPANSFTANSMLKSSIMENMGDKDIVRRALKTFQKRNDACYSAEKPNTVKHEFSSPAEQKRPISRTPARRNERLKKDSEKITTGSPSGTSSNPLLGPRKKYETGLSPHVSKTEEKPEKQREFPNKLEPKANLNAAGSAKHSRISKVAVKNEPNAAEQVKRPHRSLESRYGIKTEHINVVREDHI